MAGHNKWSKIKHKKGIADAKRSKIWTKIIREITVSARMGGGDPGSNPRLRKAIDDARSNNMPKDTMQRAITKGLGSEADNLEELIYEGYGPGGVALVVECMTDNRNRTLGEVRTIIQKKGGNLGSPGSVLFLFNKKGQLSIDKNPQNKNLPSENALLEFGLEHGLEEITDDGDCFTITSSPSDYLGLKEALQKQGFIISQSEITMIPQNLVSISGENAKKLLSMIEALEDNDDVQNVYTNMDIDEKELEKLMQ